MATLIRKRLGGHLQDAIMVGDRPSTDGLMARRLSVPFALVLTGVTGEDEISTDDPPDLVEPTLAALVARELGRPARDQAAGGGQETAQG